jgi:hypothetical protein
MLYYVVHCTVKRPDLSGGALLASPLLIIVLAFIDNKICFAEVLGQESAYACYRPIG